MSADDTIFALSTGFVKSGIGVIRISGKGVKLALSLVCDYENPTPNYAKLCSVKDIKTGEIIDQGLALYFCAPKSYTGEDVAELHIHGSRAVITNILETLNNIEGLRPAERGEFTKRAVINGKMDLTSAEGVNDLINAQTDEQRKQALRQMSGELADLYEGWQNRIKRLLAHLEAYIDFPEEDIPQDLETASTGEINALLKEIKEHLADNHKGEILRQGYSVAIIGAPNAGKSSLLNKLVKRDAAIVSSLAGTTRDIIEVFLDLDGFPVILADTAGLREAKDMVEQEGIKRALKRAASANLKLAVFDGAKYPEMDAETLSLCDKNTLKIINKSDLIGNHNVITKENDVILTNSLTGKGLDAVLAFIKKRVSDELSLRENPALTQIRHREALTECAAALSRSLKAPQTDLKAEDLRLAARAIGKITGQITVDEVLDIVFKEFCIGK